MDFIFNVSSLAPPSYRTLLATAQRDNDTRDTSREKWLAHRGRVSQMTRTRHQTKGTEWLSDWPEDVAICLALSTCFTL